MKKHLSGLGFFGKAFLIVLIIEVFAVWIGFLAGPALLWILTKNALWALLYIITFPAFLFMAAYLEMQVRTNK